MGPRVREDDNPNKKRPGFAGAFSLQPIPAKDSLLSMISAQTPLRLSRGKPLHTFPDHASLGSGFLGRALDHRRALHTAGDRNVAGLLGFRNLADEIDMQQSVLEGSVLYDHEIGEL